MSRLLSRAKVALFNAQNDYNQIHNDDCFLDACCYNLQQSIELSLKFIVEMTGQQYAENHDIRANLNILNRVDYHVTNEKVLCNMASTLYSWEVESRYKDSFTALMEDVEDAFGLAEALIQEASSMIN